MGVMRGYGWGHVAAFAGLALLLVMSTAFVPRAATQAGADIPPDRVVAQLQLSGGAYPDALRQALAAQRAAPGDEALARQAARTLIDEGRARGDSRLVGAALGILRPFLHESAPETLYLAATARQYQHDFPGALHLLDQALRLSPGDLNARLTRATIRTVRGDYAAARDDCRLIGARARPDIGFLCTATTEVLTANGPGYAARLQGLLAQPGLLDPQLKGWATGLIAEVALHQGNRPLARAQLEAVLADDPLALRERLMLADLMLDDLMLDTGQAAAARDLLAPAPETDGVLIRRALAARAMGESTEADRLAGILDRRFTLNRDLGLDAHAREEALYFLVVAPDPVQALARAEVNWALQHEIDDAILLLQAAEAAGQPEAAAPVRAWMAAEGVLPPPD